MCQSEVSEARLGLNSPDPLVREAFLMAHDYIDYVTTGGADGTMGPAPTACTAALRHAGDELLTRFPIFFRRWPRVFQDVKENTACTMLMSILDEHFFPPIPRGQHRDLAWSAVLSVYVLAGQMALHCHERGMLVVLPQLKECVGAYVERVICPEIRNKGGWSGFVSRFGEKQGLEGQVKKVCRWTLLALTISILTYFLWKRIA
ncbi:BCL2 like 16 [Sparus aurata]|uniref:Bcl-2-related ovarian killer protein homolog A-like n=1 Tax=Sparus aurata TaxID=8175 RepID=A0A671YTY2_SPAAU|nr:bcl-2-related ovarian killer protein homolog A-like [Sparus aurata]XP_030273244.1 bcl-2-related ovarian killer protein homolog A-like [Sparus aurata]